MNARDGGGLPDDGEPAQANERVEAQPARMSPELGRPDLHHRGKNRVPERRLQPDFGRDE